MKKTRLILVLLAFALILSNLTIPAVAQSPVNCNQNSDVQTMLDQIKEASVAPEFPTFAKKGVFNEEN